MSKFTVQKLNDSYIAIHIAPSATISEVDELIKALELKGVVEDLEKSTVSKRFFYKKSPDVADRLIKALNNLNRRRSSGDYAINMVRQAAAERKAREAAERKRKATSVNTSTNPVEPNVSSDLPDTFENRELLGPEKSGWLKGSVKKSGYGPKGASQYNVANNVKRKAKNAGEKIEELGPNQNVKNWGARPGQIGAKQAVELEARALRRKNKKQPVKRFSPEEIAAYEQQKKKLAASIDQYDQYDETLNKHEQEAIEKLTALMRQKSMLKNLQPSSEDFIKAGEQMGIGLPEKDVSASNRQWNNTINSWLQEATKPLTGRFSSSEEEMAYWSSIKVSGSEDDGGGAGY